MDAILIALATSFNFLIIKWKLEKARYEDAGFDVVIMFTLSSLFHGSMGGMVVAMISSFIVSIYFLFSPPKFLRSIDHKGFIEEFKSKLPNQ